MGKKSQALIICLLTATSLLTVWRFRHDPHRPPQPSFQGKSLSKWLQQTDTWRGNLTAPEAVAVRQMGTNSLPVLLEMLATQPRMALIGDDFRDTLQNVWFALPWNSPRQSNWEPSLISAMHRELKEYNGCVSIITHDTPERESQKQAVRAFRILGASAYPAVPQLRKLLGNENTVEAASLALAAIGPAAVPVLAQELTNGSPKKRDAIARVLPDMDKNAHDAVPSLLCCLKDEDVNVRRAAMKTLWQINGESQLLLPYFISGLSDPDDRVRYYAVVGCEKLGPMAKSAVPSLLKAMHDPESYVVDAAVNALSKIDQATAIKAGVVPILISRLDHPDAIDRSIAADLLADFKQQGRPAIPSLIKALDDSDWLVRQSVTNALKAIDPAAAAQAGVK